MNYILLAFSVAAGSAKSLLSKGLQNFNRTLSGLSFSKPMIRDVDTVCEFIDRYLAGKVNLIVLQTRYRYRFTSHPECMGAEPLSEAAMAEMIRMLFE